MSPDDTAQRFARRVGARRLAWLALAFALAACGRDEAPPQEEAPRVMPVERTALDIVVQRDPVTVRAALLPWAQSEGVDLRVHRATGGSLAGGLPRAEGLGEIPSLCEVDHAALAALRAADALTPICDPDDAILGQLRGSESEVIRTGFGLPWLVGVEGLLIHPRLAESSGRLSPDSPRDWAELTALTAGPRRGTGTPLGIPAGEVGLHRLLLPFARSHGSAFVDSTGAVQLANPEAEEALAFLVRLAQGARRADPDALEKAFARGELGMIPGDLASLRRLRTRMGEARPRLAPYPASSEAGQPQFLLQARCLVIPRGAAHPDLARQLVRVLTGPEPAGRVAAEDPALVPANRAFQGDPLADDVDWSHAHAAPAHPAWAQMALQLDRAVAAALELRRTPEAALAEAQRNLEAAFPGH